MQSTKHRNPLDPISARKPSALDLLLIISSYTLLLSHPIFLAGTDFGKIGPAVSAASPLGEAAARSCLGFAVHVSVAPFTWSGHIFEAGSDFGQIGPAVSGGGFRSFV